MSKTGLTQRYYYANIQSNSKGLQMDHVRNNTTLAKIDSCKWSRTIVQHDLTINYRCVHKKALQEQKNNGYVDALCLGFVDCCPDYEKHTKDIE